MGLSSGLGPFLTCSKMLLLLLLTSSSCLQKAAVDAEFVDDRRYADNYILPFDVAASHDCYRYDPILDENVPQRCVPEFINAAFNREVQASNTCGTTQAGHYCSQISIHGSTKICGVCDNRVSGYNHPARYLTDFNNPDKETWWQSDTMREGIQYPNNVTLTLHLGKAFDITYVRLKFVSPRPESFAIYKKTTADGEWIPWQYYSGSCKSTYKMPERAPILPGNEAVAQCTREFSDISPLTGGNIAFSTLDGRPSAENFEESEVLQDWVSAVAVRIVLNRLNTFGDEVFFDPKVLQTYYYAISDVTVGGRCKCNGHANSCVMSNGEGVGERLVCQCHHNTDGEDCDRCSPFFQDRPWRRGTSEEANECLPCNCSGLSSRCFFDEELFNATGHGGHCVDCTGNTQGPNCEKCLHSYYRPKNMHFCTECACDPTGSYSEQCHGESGQCECKPGVTGQRCDQCEAGFYDFTASGCKDCHCTEAGSWDNQPRCSPHTGDCQCKEKVEGQKCDKCRPGYFNLSPGNRFGCTPCFCYGHSSVCSAADGYYSVNISTAFVDGIDDWTARSERRQEQVQFAQMDQAIAVGQLDYYPVYFVASKEFTGDLRFAFNQPLVFKLKGHMEATAPGNKDLIIRSGDGNELVAPITDQGNPLPSTAVQTFRFLLHPDAGQWAPKLSEIQFITWLSNVTSISLRGTYNKGDLGFLYSFSIQSVSPSTASLVTRKEADWVESCQCPEGFVGQFCESCAPGYRRAIKFGGPLTKCIKCDCHGHSDSCDAESGACICQHNTAGDTCSQCARGYYGDALNGTENDCQQCDCPEGGPCAQLPEGGTVCTQCPLGYSGAKCEFCETEFYGDPANGKQCKPCPCNNNIDSNAIGNCDKFTGECLKCIYNTTGFNCERCRAGFYGDATEGAEYRNECRECDCFVPGSRRRLADFDILECDQYSGQCQCLPHVTGRRCDQCELGFFNIVSGKGCLACMCDPIGSEDQFCEADTGKCRCKPGVTGLKCDECAAGFFGYSFDGCEACDCDPIGSEQRECDRVSGQCLCKENVEGRRCDMCSENRYNMRSGCLPCDDCYTLIQTRRDEVVEKMNEVDQGLQYWEQNGDKVTVDDESVSRKVEEQMDSVNDLQTFVEDHLDAASIARIRKFKSLIPVTEKARSKLHQHRPVVDGIDASIDNLEEEFDDFKKVSDVYKAHIEANFSTIKKEGKRQLAKAQKLLLEFGVPDERLKEIAVEADELASKQIKIARQVREQTRKMQQNVRNAYNEAYQAVYGDRVSSRVQQLEQMTRDTTTLLKRTKLLAEKPSEDAESAYHDAAMALAKIEDLKLPTVNVADYESRIQQHKNSTMEAQKEIEKFSKLQAENEKALKVAIKEAHAQLKIAEGHNKKKMSIIRELELQKNKTQAMVDSVQDAYQKANSLLLHLEDFEQNKDSYKEDFIKELTFIDMTRETIIEANKGSREAENIVGNSEKVARDALKIALEARNQVNALSAQVAAISEAADALTASVEQAERQSDVFAKMTTVIEDTHARMKKMEELREKSLKMNRAASEMELKAKEQNQSLEQLEYTLVGMESQLRVKAPSDEELDKLEQELKRVEKTYKSKKTRRDIRALKKSDLEGQRNAIKQEFEHITQELEQLRNMYQSLPTKCFNVVNIEQ